MAAEPVFLETNVLVAGSVDAHPSHAAAVALLGRLASEEAPLVISPQICREFLANLVATMRANAISRLATLNSADFQRFEDEIRLEALASS